GSPEWAGATFLGTMQPEGAFGLPARLEHFARMFRPYSLVSRFMDPATTTQESVIRSLTGYTSYPANEWFSGPSYFSNVESALQYYRNQAIIEWQYAQEAQARGDNRAALIHQRKAEEWERMIEEWLPQFIDSLDR